MSSNNYVHSDLFPIDPAWPTPWNPPHNGPNEMELITAISQGHVLYLQYQHLWFLFLMFTSMLEPAVVGAVGWIRRLAA